MLKNTLSLLMLCLFTFGTVHAQSDTTNPALDSAIAQLIKVDSSIVYQTGKVTLDHNIEVNVPEGFKFIGAKDADKIIHEVWGNPPGTVVLGMLVKKDFTLLAGNQWSFVFSYDDDGYVKDEDAAKLDYKEIMDQVHKDEADMNAERKKQGYDPIHIIGWSATPYYDQKSHVLHWAKSIKFGSAEDTTLNYDVRLLGRKGVLSMNAVANVNQLEDIKAVIPQVLTSAHFQDGSRYEDFDDKMDKVAAYTVGGLIAGKLAAKAGLFVLIAKYFKLILLAVAGGFAAARKKIAGWFGRKPEEEPVAVAEETPPAEPEQQV